MNKKGMCTTKSVLKNTRIIHFCRVTVAPVIPAAVPDRTFSNAMISLTVIYVIILIVMAGAGT